MFTISRTGYSAIAHRCTNLYVPQSDAVVASSMTRGSKPSTSTSPCALLRDAYHNCFHRWYTEKFVKGQYDKEECVSEWQKYRACLSEHLEDKKMIRILEGENVFVQDSGVASQ